MKRSNDGNLNSVELPLLKLAVIVDCDNNKKTNAKLVGVWWKVSVEQAELIMYTIPQYFSKVLYIPQKRILLPEKKKTYLRMLRVDFTS